MLADILAVIAGLVLLFVGGEGLVRGSVAIAERLGLSKLLIGLTIVAFGTSAPELLVAVDAALNDAPEIALGNVVGSNIANVFLILGISVLIAPIVAWQRSAIRDAMVSALTALALFGLVQGDVIGRVEGGVLLAALLAYLAASYWLERRETNSVFGAETEEFEDIKFGRAWMPLVLVIGGIAALVFGADLLVTGSVAIAREFGVSDAVIGLSLVAIGTSLPELATAVVAAYRRHADVVLGNVIGSNIFNTLGIIGITAGITPLPRGEVSWTVLACMLGFALLLWPLAMTGRRLVRSEGALLLAGYGAYIGYLVATA